MDYVVQTVGDDELPVGRHVVIVECIDGPPLILVNGAPARAWALMRAWEDTLEPCTVPSVLRPPTVPIARSSAGWLALLA